MRFGSTTFTVEKTQVAESFDKLIDLDSHSEEEVEKVKSPLKGKKKDTVPTACCTPSPIKSKEELMKNMIDLHKSFSTYGQGGSNLPMFSVKKPIEFQFKTKKIPNP